MNLLQLEINGKTYGFKFGVKFVRELDKASPIERDGMNFGMALAVKVIPELQIANVATLSEVLYLANRTESPKISQGDLDNFIDEHEDIEALFDSVIKEISESNTGKLVMKSLMKSMNLQA